MRQVRAFQPDSSADFEAAVGGLALPLAAMLLFAGAFAGAWWLLEEPDALSSSDPFESAFTGLLLLALGFGGALAAVRVVSSLLGRRPYGTATLALSEGAVTGGAVRGEVHLSWRMRPDESAVVVLECRQFEEGLDGWSSAPSFLWWRERVVDGADCPPAAVTHVRLGFDVPADAPPSGTYEVAGGRDWKVEWTLTVTIEPRGRRLNFVVPVAAGAGVPTHMADDLETGEAAIDATRPAYSRIVLRAAAPGTSVFRFPPQRAAASLAAWVAITAPSWIVLPWLAWRDGRDLPWSLVGMLGIAAVVNGVPFLFLMQPRRLLVGPGGVVFHRWLMRARRLHVRDVRGAEARAMPLVNSRPLYVWLQRLTGDDVPVGQCRSVREARWLAHELERALTDAKEQRTAAMP